MQHNQCVCQLLAGLCDVTSWHPGTHSLSATPPAAPVCDCSMNPQQVGWQRPGNLHCCIQLQPRHSSFLPSLPTTSMLMLIVTHEGVSASAGCFYHHDDSPAYGLFGSAAPLMACASCSACSRKGWYSRSWTALYTRLVFVCVCGRGRDTGERDTHTQGAVAR